MFTDNSSDITLPPSYYSEDNDLRVRYSKVACILALFMIPSGSLLDYMIYPELFFQLTIIRLLLTGWVAFLLVLHFIPFGSTHIKIISSVWALSINFAISTMIFISEGSLSPYYAGLNLVILGAGVLFPWTIRETAFVCVCTLFMYLGASLLHYWIINPQEKWDILFNNCFFIISKIFQNIPRVCDIFLRCKVF